MCGIAGWLGHLPDDVQYAQAVAAALRHRGPDGSAVRTVPGATLVHTRLSILDLSPAGAQPFASEDQAVWSLCNGEIYNHLELRRWLERRGHAFTGRSDCEILPHLYEEEGPALVERLRGMFALAVYDSRSSTLFLARDRFGIKPLFTATTNGPQGERLSFASELRPLLALPGVDVQPDGQAVHDLAALSYIPAPQTFFRGVRALEPGHVLEARLDGGRIHQKQRAFHRWVVAPDEGATLRRAEARAGELVEQAVRRQLESDVPLGALLSGGIDSSLVSAAAQHGVGGDLRTFNVRFPDEQYDETWAAVAVADHIGSRHQTLDVAPGQGSWEAAADLLEHAGQPFADTSVFAVHAVSRLMRQHVTVALSGDGGDEAFGGYGAFWQIADVLRAQRVPAPALLAGSAALSLVARAGLVPRRLPQHLRDLAGADDTAIVEHLMSWVRGPEHRRLFRHDGYLPVRRLFEPRWERVLPARTARLERLSTLLTEAKTRLQLPSDYLFKVDMASMRESLEVRVPMLDEDLFAFGLTLPHRLKVRGRTGKQVLRAVARRRLPAQVASKGKRGFGIPVDTWVDTRFRERLRDELLGRASRLPEFFHPTGYRPLVEALCSGRSLPGVSREGLYQRVVMLLSVHLATSAAPATATERHQMGRIVAK